MEKEILRSDDNNIIVRKAQESDLSIIKQLFLNSYGQEYPYAQFYQEEWLRRCLYNDQTILLVAEDIKNSSLLGTASVVLGIGSHNDLMGEFGRLVVFKHARCRGIGNLLMKARLLLVQDQLQIAIVENRTTHPYSQKISTKHGMIAAGLLPLKHNFGKRESMALYIRHFGDCLKLRKNNPHIISQIYPLAYDVLSACHIDFDAVVEHHVQSYTHDKSYFLESFKNEFYPHLLQLQRGRTIDREVFGPVRLHYGFFRLGQKGAHYLVARKKKDGPIVGAIGHIYDPTDRLLKIIEILHLEESVVPFLVDELIKIMQRQQMLDYIEVDVSAYAPRMQKTLWELGLIPAGYIPSMVFHDVERLDIIKMVKLLTDFKQSEFNVLPPLIPLAKTLTETFHYQKIEPWILKKMFNSHLMEGLDQSTCKILLNKGKIKEYNKDLALFHKGEESTHLAFILSGQIGIGNISQGKVITQLYPGQILGELSLLGDSWHGYDAWPIEQSTLMLWTKEDFFKILEQFPQLGQKIYKNIAKNLANKLKTTNNKISLDKISHHHQAPL